MGITNMQNQVATFTTNLANYVHSYKGVYFVGTMGKLLESLGKVYQDEELVVPVNVAASEIIRHVGSAASQILEVVQQEANKVEKNEKLLNAFKEIEELEDSNETMAEFAKAMEYFQSACEELRNATTQDKE